MKIERHIFKSYLSAIEGSVGTEMFQHFWASFDGEERDTMENGWKACAYYVSSLLAIFGVIDKPHSTVVSTIEALKKTGWQKVEQPEAGDILVWEDQKPTPEDDPVSHMGFYVGNEKAISNSWHERAPKKHDWLFRDTSERAINEIYRGKDLMPDDIKIIEQM